MVVAVGDAAVGGGGEELFVLQGGQHGGTAARAQQCVAQVAGQHPQRRRPDQEVEAAGVHAAQHVAGQVRTDQPGAAAEFADRPLPLGAAAVLGGQVEQVQPGRPPPGAPGQRRRALRRQRRVVDDPEQLLHLPRPEPQIVAVEFQQLLRDHQPRGVHRRRAATAQNDRDLPRPHGQQGLQGAFGGGAGQLLQVVDEEHRGAWPGLVELADQVADPPAGRRGGEARILQRGGQGMAEIPGDGGRVVLASGPVPADRGLPGRELAQQGGLAAAGRAEHERRGERSRGPRPQPGRGGVEPIADQAARARTPDLLQEDHRFHADLPEGHAPADDGIRVAGLPVPAGFWEWRGRFIAAEFMGDGRAVERGWGCAILPPFAAFPPDGNGR